MHSNKGACTYLVQGRRSAQAVLADVLGFLAARDGTVVARPVHLHVPRGAANVQLQGVVPPLLAVVQVRQHLAPNVVRWGAHTKCWTHGKIGARKV